MFKKIKQKILKNLLLKAYNDTKKKEKNHFRFRLTGRHLFLTYPQVKIERETVLDQLKGKLEPFKVESYVISTEKHEGGEEHIHAYLKLDRRCNITDKTRLDIKVGEEEKHGNYQTCRSYMSVISYIVKGGMSEVLTNMDLDDRGRVKNSWKEIYDEIKAGKEVEEVLERVGGIAPRLMVTDYTKIRRSVVDLRQSQNRPKNQVYALESFVEVPEIREYTEKFLWEKTLYLRGATGTGKTEYTKALYTGLVGEGKVLRITDVEGLSKLKEKEYKALIMDDVNITKLSPEQVINLVDVKNTGTHRVLYGTVEIPAGLPRAIISNLKLEDVLKRMNIDVVQLEAIVRRCFKVDIKGRKLRFKLELQVEEEEKT